MTGSATPSPLGAGRTRAALIRQGFADPQGAGGILARLGMWDEEQARAAGPDSAAVISAMGRAADPDLALRGLETILGAQPDDALRRALGEDAVLRRGLIEVLGVSRTLADHLRAQPQDWRLLSAHDRRHAGDEQANAAMRRRVLASVGADDADPVTGTGGRRSTLPENEAVAALTLAYRRELLVIAAADLAADDAIDLERTMASLADLAAATVQASLAVAAAELPPGAAPVRLAVVGMGKTGGRELNYVSDVDVIFVAEPEPGPDGPAPDAPALDTAARLASRAMQLCARVAWQVDAALRPEGKAGPLVRTLASQEAYYKRWASTWEFQALLKARPIAGDQALGERYMAMIAPMVWSAAGRPNFVADVQAMRRKVISHLSSDIAEREIKLGPGGLRDIEFAVQLLQLVHGRADESLRSPATLPALAALRDGGYVGMDDAVSLADAYGFLRAVEHRLQLRQLRRTHLVPADQPSVQWLARAMGFRPDKRGDAASVFAAEWALHAREVRRLHEKIFYRPLLEAVARVPTEDLRLSPEQAGERLAALGFTDPAGALGHIAALTEGMSRRAAIQRTLLPVLLAQFSEAPDPDAGLLSYRRVSDALGETPWYLRLLRDTGQVAHRLAALLGASRYVADLLLRAPDGLQMLADDEELVPRGRAELDATLSDLVSRHEDADSAIRAIRGVRRHELLRISCADLLGQIGVLEAGRALSALTDATLQSALDVAQREVAQIAGLPDPADLPMRLAVIAMGRLGGYEVSYGSDADVMFVYRVQPGADETAAARAARDAVERMRALLAQPAPDPPLGVDANLRPEGRNGPLVRTLESFRQYYARWSSVWEAQALLRARPCAGDAELGEEFLALIEPIRWPQDGLSVEQVREIRRIKARVDSERLPRGADASTHTKLGRGGLADIEWTLQLIQLQHAGRRPQLRTTGTLDALHSALADGLVTAQQGADLEGAWLFATRVRNAIMLTANRPGDQLPSRGRPLTAVGRALGYPVGFDPGQLDDDFRRATRRARRAVEQLFYG